MRLWRKSSGTNQEKPKGFFWASGASARLTDSDTGGSASATSNMSGRHCMRAASTERGSGLVWPGRTQASVCSPCLTISAGERLEIASGGAVSGMVPMDCRSVSASGRNTTAGSGRLDQSSCGHSASPALSPSASSASISEGKSNGGAKRCSTSAASKGRR